MEVTIFINLAVLQLAFCYITDKETSIQLPTEKADTRLLREVIKQIVAQNNFRTMYVYRNMTSDFPNDLIQHIRLPYMLVSKHKQREPFAAVKFPDNFLTIIFTDRCSYILPLILDGINSMQLVNRSKVLVVLSENPGERLKELFRNLWKSAVLNVIVICVGRNRGIFTYNPYNKQYLIEIKPEQKVIYYPDKCRNMYGAKQRLMFFKITPDAVKVRWKGDWIWLGSAVEETPVLMGYINATAVIEIKENITFGVELFVNKTYSYVTGGASLGLIEGKQDIASQREFLSPSLLFEYTQPPGLTVKVFLIPKAKPIPFYLTFLSESKKAVGYGVVFSLLITSITLKVFSTISGYKLNFLDLVFNMFATFMAQIGLNVRMSSSMQTVSGTWLLFSIVVMTCISGELLRTFIVTTYEKEIDDPTMALQVPYWNFYTFDGYVDFLITKIYVYKNSTPDFGVNVLLQNAQIPCVLVSKYMKKEPFATIKFEDNFITIAFSDTYASIVPIILEGINSMQLVSRSKVLVVLNEKPDERLKETFQNLWKSSVFNIVVLCIGHGNSLRLQPDHKIIYYPDKCHMYGAKQRTMLFKLRPDAVKVGWKEDWIWVGFIVEKIPVLMANANETPLIEINENVTFGVELFVNKSYSYVTGGATLGVIGGKVDIASERESVFPSLLFDYIQPTELTAKILLIPKARPIPFYLTYLLPPKRKSRMGLFSL
ncbi:unnamed protein product [Hermetia illucens]|uniref:Uncharacterized protein n=1 Tax=Hermetia illucens TaxID=343691 RepID=A0A7R8UK97_HERIL|nr:unnamed protein product [Hermetia illucens]